MCKVLQKNTWYILSAIQTLLLPYFIITIMLWNKYYYFWNEETGLVYESEMLSALNSRKLTNSDLMFSIYLSHPPPLPVFHIKQSRDKRLLTHRSWFNIPGLVSWRLFRSFPHGHKMAAQFQASCLFSKKNGIKKEAGATGFICSFIRRAKTSPKLFP